MNQQQGCRWRSGGSVGIRGSNLIFFGFFKENLIITDHFAASQPCGFWENHLTGDKLG